MSLGFNRIEDLPAKYQGQARQKLGSDGFAKESKYHNKPTEVDGHLFPSEQEATRYGELKLLYEAKEISALSLQVPFFLPGGIIYVADFVYYDIGEKHWVVEDSKGVRTKEYIMKKKLMLEIGIEIQEV
jgi:hypothetical protein